MTSFQTDEKLSQIIDNFTELLTSYAIYETRSDSNRSSY